MIILSALGTAYGIDFKAYVVKLKEIKDISCKRNNFRICRRRARAETFNAELMEFSESSCLRLFVSVAGGEIKILLWERLIKKTVLKKSSYRACRTLGTK